MGIVVFFFVIAWKSLDQFFWILKIINVSYNQTRLEFVPTCCLQLSADSFLLPRNRGIEFSREMKRGWGGEEKGG